MLDKVKLALRLRGTAFDSELSDMIDEALADLKIMHITAAEEDPLIRRAIITFCKLHFGTPEDADRLQESYNAQKATLSTATGYTDWGLSDES